MKPEIFDVVVEEIRKKAGVEGLTFGWRVEVGWFWPVQTRSIEVFRYGEALKHVEGGTAVRLDWDLVTRTPTGITIGASDIRAAMGLQAV